MNRIAYLFPGQGAQYVGMGQDFANSFAVAMQTFEEADDVLSMHLSRLIFEGPEDTLTQTKHSQLAIFVTSVAILRTIHQQFPDLQPFVCAGLSLGEYTALFASGRLGFKDTLLLVRERSRLMNDVCEKIPGSMAAVLGLGANEIERIVEDIDGVWIANYNGPGQVVISGTRAGLELAQKKLKAEGARRVIPLVVHGAFHSGLMKSAQDGLASFLDAASLMEASTGFVMNVPGDFVLSLEEVRQHLVFQVTQPVRWEQSIRAMEGVELFLEIGCGKTLAGLNKKMDVGNTTLSIERVIDLEQVGHAICSNC